MLRRRPAVVVARRPAHWLVALALSASALLLVFATRRAGCSGGECSILGAGALPTGLEGPGQRESGSRRGALSVGGAATLTGLFGDPGGTPLGGGIARAEVELRRGLEVVGWQGKRLQVPTGVENSAVTHAFDGVEWPSAWPYTLDDFRRLDESDDGNFYGAPRFVTHIDDLAIGAIRDFYALQFAQAPQGDYAVLDICSSWISHYPRDLRARRVAITGMNQRELAANKQATEFVARDLNKEPKLPFGDSEFDFVTNVVSVDYLSRPREIFEEMHRVLKPGGVAIMSFSNRCFFTKAIAMWRANMSDGPGHCRIVGNYFRFNPSGGWRDISSIDISADPRKTNPMWVVTAVKA